MDRDGVRFSLLWVVWACALLCACIPRASESAQPTAAQTSPAPVEILEAPEIAAEMTAVPAPAETEAALDARMLACAVRIGSVRIEHVRAVMRYLCKQDPAYLSALEESQRPVVFYREAALDGGMLVLAAPPFPGEVALYSVVNDAASPLTAVQPGVVHSGGRTILFGAPCASGGDRIVAELSNGRIAEQPSNTPDDGYLLALDGTAELTALWLYSGQTQVRSLLPGGEA